MPVSRTSTPQPSTSRTPYPSRQLPLTRKNLACHLLHQRERLYSHDCPNIEIGSSTKAPSSRIAITDPGQAYTPSPSERSQTKEHRYPMGYEWQVQVAVRTRRRFRNSGPPPLRQSVIRYNDLPNWNRTPSPAPAYNTVDPHPPLTNAWNGTYPNYPPFWRIFKERFGYCKGKAEGFDVVFPVDWRYRREDTGTFPVWVLNTKYHETGDDFADSLEVMYMLDVGVDTDYWEGAM